MLAWHANTGQPGLRTAVSMWETVEELVEEKVEEVVARKVERKKEEKVEETAVRIFQ